MITAGSLLISLAFREANFHGQGDLPPSVARGRFHLEKLTDRGELSEFYHRTLIELSNKVVGKLAGDYENVVKGVDEIMGGKLIETEARKIMDEGRREGRQAEIVNTERERLRADAAELRYQDSEKMFKESEKRNQELSATVSWLQEQMKQLQMKLTQVGLAE